MRQALTVSYRERPQFGKALLAAYSNRIKHSPECISKLLGNGGSYAINIFTKSCEILVMKSCPRCIMRGKVFGFPLLQYIE
jgi:hypothetical protein